MPNGRMTYGTAICSSSDRPEIPSGPSKNFSRPPTASQSSSERTRKAPVASATGTNVVPMAKTSGPLLATTEVWILVCSSAALAMVSNSIAVPVSASNASAVCRCHSRCSSG
jgi:hypothetical protein